MYIKKRKHTRTEVWSTPIDIRKTIKHEKRLRRMTNEEEI